MIDNFRKTEQMFGMDILSICPGVSILPKSVMFIPLLGNIPAGHPADHSERREACVPVDMSTLSLKTGPRLFALRVEGDSMIGKSILPGDIVVLEHGREPRHGQIVAALIDGASTLKTYLLRNRKPVLKAENPSYPELIPADELVIQGVFVTLIRQDVVLSGYGANHCSS